MLNRAKRGRRALRLYERGLERCAGRWARTSVDGARFLDDHPYARDLDLFGSGSLFELINTARSEAGEATLAEWLKRGTATDKVLDRQIAVDELRSRLDFREDIAELVAEGAVSRTGVVARWAAAPPVGIERFVPALFGGCGGMLVALALLAYQGVLPWSLVSGWLLVETAAVRASHAVGRLTQIVSLRESPARNLVLHALYDLPARP